MELFCLVILFFVAVSMAASNKPNKLRRKLATGKKSCLVVEVAVLDLPAGLDPTTYEAEYTEEKTIKRCIFEDEGDAAYTIEGDMDVLADIWAPNKDSKSGTELLNYPVSAIEKIPPKDGHRGGIIKIKSPQNIDLTEIKTKGHKKKRSLLQHEGTSSVLVIRVTDQTGDQPSLSAAQLSSHVFSDSQNLVNRYQACSGGLLNFEKAIGPNIVDGVAEITVPYTVAGVDKYTVEDWAVDEAYYALGAYWQYTHVMFVVPNSVNFNGAAAYAYINYGRSVYRDIYASHVQVLVHEIGHNLNHRHSGETGSTYGDGTCMMGAAVWHDDHPLMCFNGAKSWYFGWYADKHVEIDPFNIPYEGKLVGINDFVNGEITSSGEDVIARVGSDLYLMYNRKEGINSGVVEKPDMVTVVEQSYPQQTQSWIRAGLSAGDEWRSPNWNGGGYDLVVEVCETVNGIPDYARTLVYLDGLNNISCQGTPEPTTAPPTTEVPTTSPPTTQPPTTALPTTPRPTTSPPTSAPPTTNPPTTLPPTTAPPTTPAPTTLPPTTIPPTTSPPTTLPPTTISPTTLNPTTLPPTTTPPATNPPTTLPPNTANPSTSSPTTSRGARGDPHIKSWNGSLYDFHGVCDLVLLQNPGFQNGLGMEINMRTKKYRQWSYISTAVIRIGDDTFEVMAEKTKNRYWINGVLGEELFRDTIIPTTISDYSIQYKIKNSQQMEYTIDLNQGEKIVFKTWHNMVRLDIVGATAENFASSVGLMGTFHDGSKIARDNSTILADVNDFGQEWQVLPSEPVLFHSIEGPQAPNKCEIPSQIQLRRRMAQSNVSLEAAEAACANIEDKNDFDLCVFDVMATSDIHISSSY